MPESWRIPLFYLSLGMNIAFLLVLGFFALPGVEIEYLDDKDHPRRDKGHERSARSNDSNDKEPGWYLYRKKMGVSDTQWKNIRRNMEDFHSEALGLCRQISKLRDEIITLIEESDSNREAIRRKESRIADLRQKKHALFVDYMNAKKEHLTRRQREQFFAKIREKSNCYRHKRFLDRE